MNKILGKRQLILTCLVVALGAAVYLDYSFSKSGKGYDVSDKVTSQTYGESEWVDNSFDIPSGDKSYFAQARLTREKTRDESVEALQTMLSNAELTKDQQDSLTTEATQLAKSIEKEGKIENLIKAKGFTECMAYYDGTQVDVIVKTKGLTQEQATQIQDIILSETDVASENISVVEVE